MYKGAILSAVFHIAITAIAIIGLPRFLEPEPIALEVPILVDVITAGEVTNLPKVEPLPEPEPAPQPEPPPEPPPEPEPPPPEPDPQAMPEPPAPDVAPEPAPKPEPKPEPKPAPKPEPKPSLMDLLGKAKNIKKKAPPTAADQQLAGRTDSGGSYDPTKPMSVSEMAAIKDHIKKCWRAPLGAKNPENLIVTVAVQFNQDGTVRAMDVKEKARMMTDSFFRAAADTAVRAIDLCSPYSMLKPERYESWKAVDLQFDPSKMVGR